MITDEERRFVIYWEKNRVKEKKIVRQWLVGMPIGLLFAIPILLNFSMGWYKRANMWARAHSGDSGTIVIIVAVLLISTFIAIFYKQHRWDRYEQQYLEIQAKITKEQLFDKESADK
jgi:membrane protein YdbS with pleckstrin-like domain